MLVCFGLFGLLLFNTVVANAVCSFTYSKRDEIQAISREYQSRGYKKCDYHIHAPRNNFIKLNFTNFFGFRTQPSMHSGYLKPSSDLCIPPEIVIREREEDSDLQLFVKICKNQKNLQSPKVFHSSLNYLKITYIWIENQASGFTLDFEFHHNKNNCVHFCDDHQCLSDSSLLCNGVYECSDRSDEYNCPRISPNTGSDQSADVDLVKTVAILISVVLMPGLFVIICVVSPCRLRSRMWRRSRRRSRETIEHSQLRPNSQASEVVYVPTSTTSQDQLLEQQMSLVRERQVKLQSIQTDTMLDLPPQIPISKDGEEGYIDSQKHLMLKRSRQLNDHLCFRPPPNKNVHDIDLERPPPYYSNSSSLENIAEPPTRIVRDSNGLPVIHRCYSMSSNGQKSGISPGLVAKTHSRTMSTNSSGHTRTVLSSSHLSEHLDEPPDYSAFSSDNSTQNSPTVDNKV